MHHNDSFKPIVTIFRSLTDFSFMTNAPATIGIRAATLEDAAIIAEFNRRLAWETEEIRLKPDVIEAGVMGMLTDPAKGKYYLATVDGRVVGQIMHTFEWSDWRNGFLWWIQSVYVQQEYRSQGVFRALFEHLRKEAEKSDGVGLRLYVEEENHTAQQVYHKLGMSHGGYHVLELPLVNRFADR